MKELDGLKIWVRVAMLSTLLLAGCATEDAVFVTKSSISVLDVDGTPGSVSFAYDRVEGFIGPNYANGAVPPVVASIQTDGKIINPKIKQLYATGDAASIVVNPSVTEYAATDKDNLVGERKTMLFGTSTTLGFKLGFARDNPSFTLGYKRKEVSYIPLRHFGEGQPDIYSSVLAGIDTTVDKENNKFKFENGQFFATGESAKQLAAQSYIKDIFKRRTEDTLAAFDQGVASQSALHSDILRCAFNLTPEQWEKVVNDGKNANLFAGLDDELASLATQYKEGPNAENKLALLQIYSEAIAGGIDPESDKRGEAMQAHKESVCNPLTDQE